MYQDVTSVDSGCGLQLRGSRIVVFSGGTFAFVLRLVVAFGCGFLAGCHVEIWLLKVPRKNSVFRRACGVALVNKRIQNHFHFLVAWRLVLNTLKELKEKRCRVQALSGYTLR